MKNIFLILIGIFVIIGCEREEIESNDVETSIMNLNVDEESYKIVNRKDDIMISGNENCSTIYINSSFQEQGKAKFKLEFDILNSGELKKVRYDEYDDTSGTSNLNKVYLTPNFNPTSSFSISNFVYDISEQKISFNFEGVVYQENNENISRNLSGNIKMDAFKSIDCSFIPNSISHESENFQFNSIYTRINTVVNQEKEYVFYSNNGQKITLEVGTSLWDLEEGKYIFDESSIQNKVNFRKYIGELAASQVALFKEDEWETYETRGEFIIENKIIGDNNEQKVTGTIHMQVLKNDQLIYDITNMSYTVALH